MPAAKPVTPPLPKPRRPQGALLEGDLERQRIGKGEVRSAPRKAGRTVAITAMVTPGERDVIDRAAKSAGMSRAGWAREVILNAAESPR